MLAPLLRASRRSPVVRTGLRAVASSTFAEPPLPSPEDRGLDRTGAVSDEADPFSSRKLQGKGGAFRGRDVVPMWIADMDFRSAPPVVDAVVACAARGLYGYTNPPKELTRLTVARLGSTYGCPEAREDWIMWLSGLVPGLHHAVRATHAGSVAVLTPAYPPFLSAPPHNGAELLTIPLLAEQVADGVGEVRFDIDWAGLTDALARPSTRLLLLCNPHNPSGRVFSQADLERIAR